MGVSQARMLVFARPTPGTCDEGRLESRIAKFLNAGPSAEVLDELTFGTRFAGKIADYLLDQRRLIVELKTVKGDPSARVSALVRDAMAEEPRMFAVGRVGIQPMLQKRANGEEVNRQMVHIGGRAVRQQLQRADKQIAATRRAFGVESATGLAVLVLEQGQRIEASLVAYAVRHALMGASPLTNIDYVWAAMENHTIHLPDGGLGYPEMLMWREGDTPERTRALLGSMLDAWAAAEGTELVHVDHTRSWGTLSPVGDGWPLELSIGQ